MTALIAQAALAAALAGSASVPPLDLKISGATRLLLIVPHPDDGVLGAGGLIRRVISRGGRVRVVWITSGDAFPTGVSKVEASGLSTAHLTSRNYQSYGVIREYEAETALRTLGVSRHSLTFLGFPDEGLCELASTHLPASAQVFQSPYTGRMSPPLAEQIIPGVQYRGLDLGRELERVVVAFRPTLIVAPHPADEHPDHCATHRFLKAALDTMASKGWTRPRVLHYLIHYRGWPLSERTDWDALYPPEGLAAADGRWVSLTLTPAEIASKREALLAHHSQLLVMRPFMLSFVRTNELFLEGEPTTLPKCWCNGENIATDAPPASLRRRPPRP
jgi:LmbE family N-acetylglucosaminyl deacetylase